MTNTLRSAGIVLSIAAIVAACGGSAATTAPAATGTPAGTPTNAPGTPTVAPSTGVSGDIVISGSSTVGPISAGVKDLFNAINPNVAISVEEPGTGDGFKAFCAGETDISDASRAIKAVGEADVCAAANIDYIELKIGLDGLSVITSAANTTGPECLTFNDLYALTGPESGPTGMDGTAQTPFANWSDAQTLATELGSTTTLPDAPLTITAPGEESGTYDFYVEKVITPIATARAMTDFAMRPDYVSSGDDNVIIDGIAGTTSDTTTLGFVGFAYVENALDRVKPLAIDGGTGTCVDPTYETIADGSYPISRPLFIYVNTARAAANPALQAFVDFYLAGGTLDQVFELPTAHYVALDDATFAATVAAWDAH